MHRDPVSNLPELAAAALVLASKYEDVECILAQDIARHEDTLSAAGIAQTEWRAARALGYRLGGGTARCWALHLLRGCKPYNEKELSYVLDRALLDGETLPLPRPTLAQQIVSRFLGGVKMDDCDVLAVCCIDKHAEHLGLEPLMHT